MNNLVNTIIHQPLVAQLISGMLVAVLVEVAKGLRSNDPLRTGTLRAVAALLSLLLALVQVALGSEPAGLGVPALAQTWVAATLTLGASVVTYFGTLKAPNDK